MRPGRIRIPDDKALPQIERLLDVDAISPILERMLGDDRRVSSVSVAYVRYRPAKRLLVLYELDCAGITATVVAQANSGGRDLAERATRGESLTLVARVAGRFLASTPLAYDSGLDAPSPPCLRRRVARWASPGTSRRSPSESRSTRVDHRVVDERCLAVDAGEPQQRKGAAALQQQLVEDRPARAIGVEEGGRDRGHVHP